MNPEASIQFIAPKRLVGIGARMTVERDSTTQLWQTLMPRRREITGRVSSNYVSLMVYDRGCGLGPAFSVDTEFEKWAAVEVQDASPVPAGMRAYRLAGGNYAVFRHQGPAHRFEATRAYIFGDWLPSSGFELDEREHFEVLPENWRPDDDNAYEDVFVPIRSVRSGGG